MSFLPWVRIWIGLAMAASVAGWILSAAGQLNPVGYAVAAAVVGGVFFAARRELLSGVRSFGWRHVARRFGRPLPLAFAGLAALVFLGGALHAPNNYDALTYRLPRVLHWLAQERWHWIHTVNPRMNDRSCGFEWLMAPVLLLTKSDRLLFLLNFVPYLLLPGLLFSVFTRLGVKGRVAWHWMWLLPTGYCFLLQGGSVGNDSFAAVFALASVDFALRAGASRKIMDVWLSLLAAAAMTGAKSGNLPLLLPWFLAFVPVAAILLTRPLTSLTVMAMALLISFLPTALLNFHGCGDWSGLVLEPAKMRAHNPAMATLANSAMVLIANLTPTFFPWAGWWNQHALNFLPENWSSLLLANMQGQFYFLGELPAEEEIGVGFGVSCLLAATVLAGRFRRGDAPTHRLGWRQWTLLTAPYGSLLFFFSHSGMEYPARLIAAYYPLLLPALLCGSAASIAVRQHWWRWGTYGVLLLALATVVLTPSRPLWPAQTILAQVSDSGPKGYFVKRAREVYSVYADRFDPLACVRATLPSNCKVIGFAGGYNDPEISFWRPFSRHRVEWIMPDDSEADVRRRQIEYAVVGEIRLRIEQQTLPEWLQKYHATLLATCTSVLTVSSGPCQWYAVHLTPPQASDIPSP